MELTDKEDIVREAGRIALGPTGEVRRTLEMAALQIQVLTEIAVQLTNIEFSLRLIRETQAAGSVR